VPTCLGLALTEPRNRPAALWFIGDTSPRGNLLPTVVGTARLVQRAQAEGVQTVLIDTTGLVDGALGRVLKYHKALAAGVDQVVAIQRVSELEAILTLLDGVGPTIHRVGPSPRARDRGPDERKAYREARYQEHLHDGRVLRLDPRCLVAPDWKPGPCPGRQQPAIGTLVGLLDREGFCLGLGTIEQIQSDRLLVYTTWKDPETVALIQVGTVRLNRREGWSEIR
jgi:polynucleotide 5'-kinase involved in rRNA processing